MALDDVMAKIQKAHQGDKTARDQLVMIDKEYDFVVLIRVRNFLINAPSNASVNGAENNNIRVFYRFQAIPHNVFLGTIHVVNIGCGVANSRLWKIPPDQIKLVLLDFGSVLPLVMRVINIIALVHM